MSLGRPTVPDDLELQLQLKTYLTDPAYARKYWPNYEKKLVKLDSPSGPIEVPVAAQLKSLANVSLRQSPQALECLTSTLINTLPASRGRMRSLCWAIR